MWADNLDKLRDEMHLAVRTEFSGQGIKTLKNLNFPENLDSIVLSTGLVDHDLECDLPARLFAFSTAHAAVRSFSKDINDGVFFLN